MNCLSVIIPCKTRRLKNITRDYLELKLWSYTNKHVQVSFYRKSTACLFHCDGRFVIMNTCDEKECSISDPSTRLSTQVVHTLVFYVITLYISMYERLSDISTFNIRYRLRVEFSGLRSIFVLNLSSILKWFIYWGRDLKSVMFSTLKDFVETYIQSRMKLREQIKIALW